MTLRARLVGLCGLLGVALSLALLLYLPAQMDAQSRRWLESRSLGIARLLATATEAAVDFDDPVSAAASLESLEATRGAAYALLQRPDGSVLASWRRPDPSALPEMRGGDPVAFHGDLIHVRIPVLTRTGRAGSLRLGFDLQELEERRREARATVFGMSLVLVVVGLAGTFLIGTLLVRPLRRITDVARRITAGDDRAARDLPLGLGDEAGAMATAFASMLRRLYEQQLRINSLNDDLEQRVAERTEALEHANREIALRLSELRRTQEQLVVADRRISLGRLAAGVAHEINNPLAFILGNLEFLARELPELRAGPGRGVPDRALREIASAVEQAAEGAERVRHIVRGLKAFSRDDEDTRTPTSLAEAIDSAIGMAAHEIKHRARLVRSLGAAPLVDANEVRLTQVFLNLFVNAAQAIPEGATDRNEIRVSLRTDERGWAVAEVSDTGGGMPPEVLARLFEPFFTTKPVGEGTGLGLSISRGIIAALGGSITARSDVGAGSTFSVALPPSAWQEVAKAAPSAPAPAAAPRARLLVVDDEPLVATAVRRALARHHDVEIANSGTAALERIRGGERFDRILCDLMMPGMSGAEFHAELTRVDGELADRVTFMTGGAFTDSTREFLEHSRQPWLEKPLDLQQLRRLVDGARV